MFSRWEFAIQRRLFSLKEKSKLLSLDDVQQRLSLLADRYKLTGSECEVVSLDEALGRVLSTEVTSQIDVPPTDNSAVDGYALKFSGTLSGVSYRVSQRIPAGASPTALEEGTCARIFTGATIPEGADCVVMQEDAEYCADTDTVSFRCDSSEGANIRKLGQDVKDGSTVLNSGKIIGPPELGLLASVGIARVKVFRKLKVAIVSTGDELVEPGEVLAQGQIYNSNRPLMRSLLSCLGVEVIDFGIVQDDFGTTQAVLRKAAEQADIVLSSGGASVGEEDYIQRSISELGELAFWRIAIKPGKPFMYGNIAGTPILGLPGNPSAVLVTFCILVRPFIRLIQGAGAEHVASIDLPLGFDVRRAGIRREFLRVRFDEGVLIKHPNQSSGMLSSASWADGLAVIPEGMAPNQGEAVSFYSFAELFSSFK